MDELITFKSREELRQWLYDNADKSGGVWLLFGKPGGPVTVKAGEALEEALCFGWIDGQMKSLDEKTYKKYFAPRREGSRWSSKNKALAEKLIASGKMSVRGLSEIEKAKKNGVWDAPPPGEVTPEQVEQLLALIRGHEPAYTNLMAMPPSVRKTYTRAYLDAKTEETRARRLAWLIDRLDRNLKPMDSDKSPKPGGA